MNDSVYSCVFPVVVYDEKEHINKENGTGFFVKENLFVTAKHVLKHYVESENSIFILKQTPSKEKKIKCEIFFKHCEHDLVVLRTKNYNSLVYNKVVDEININEERNFSFFSFSKGFENLGHLFEIKSSIKLRDIELSGEDYEFYLEQSIQNLKGASGSPIFLNNMIVAIITKQTAEPQVRSVLAIRESLLEVAKLFDFVSSSPRLNDFEQKLLLNDEKFIAKNIKNRKYIPQIFIEMDDTKDIFRHITLPILFLEKIKFDLKKIDINPANAVLQTYGLDTIEDVPTNIISNSQQNFYENLEITFEKLNEFSKKVRNFDRKFGVKTEKFDFSTALYGHQFGFIFSIEELVEKLDLMNKKIFIVKALAGHGKTNFICDFVNNFIVFHKIPSVVFDATDIMSDDIVETLNSFISTYLKITKTEFIKLLNEEWKFRQKQFVLIIDGINELADSKKFENSLYRLIDEYRDLPYFKVILTCRTELFENRYEIISSDENIVKKNIFPRNSQEDVFSTRIFKGYLNFFNIDIKMITNTAFDQLTDNPLLLRIFSETYGNDHQNESLTIEHLNLSKLFDEFLRIQQDRICKNDSEKVMFENIIQKIIKNMLDTVNFSNVKFDIFSQREIEFMDKIFEESVMYKKGVSEVQGLRTKTTFNVSFTYDEMRDFLLSSYLFENYNNDNKKYERKISSFTSGSEEYYIVTEGVRKYLFLAEREFENERFKSFLVCQEWYEKVFMENILILSNNQITESDMIMLEENILNETAPYKKIICNMIHRRNPKEEGKLDIQFLFKLLTNENQKNITFFQNLFDRYEYGYYESDSFAFILERYLATYIDKGNIVEEKNRRLISLLILMSPYDWQLEELLEKCKEKYKDIYEQEYEFLRENNFIKSEV
ncbi:hypothetical protein P7H62_06830 [Vagococcus carniphilus]|uniref:NACHT domain-containing protein n=1 Tax=Vagococcus carniphilus TaxID=218144 RepID=A0AAW8U1A6_9ENTE|nr:trypsin-like peptidase domain-containing protein [Vagococcus carniphilus]MDT2831149.1 hypothetical protein [Vagococcus carniphilus]MDT2833336.1 hypothetical protein [Vagococcus carniphilus]MDT2839692.1 hypothetical protein [Vagococcus carniphilus]MDT2854161.1 hypothetical protein [Vagococcus carniphilus]